MTIASWARGTTQDISFKSLVHVPLPQVSKWKRSPFKYNSNHSLHFSKIWRYLHWQVFERFTTPLIISSRILTNIVPFLGSTASYYIIELPQDPSINLKLWKISTINKSTQNKHQRTSQFPRTKSHKIQPSATSTWDSFPRTKSDKIQNKISTY